MIKYITGFIASFMMMGSALAADITIETRADGSGTYIYYTGKTTQWDLKNLEAIYDKAVKQAGTGTGKMKQITHPDGSVSWVEDNSLPFLNVIVMNGPGGDGQAAIELAHFINEKGMMTVANGECYSACSLMWLAGGMENRYLFGNEALIGFHFAYTSDVRALENMRDLEGWFGMQNYISQNSHYYTAHLLYYGVIDPAYFVYELSVNGSHSSFYEVTASNLNETVGGYVIN